MRLLNRLNFACAASLLALVIALSTAPASAHVTDSFAHLWNEHLAPRLGDKGTINKATNPVHWTKLKGVPAGLADGTDTGARALEIVTVDRTVTPGSGDYFDSAFIDVNCPAGKKVLGGGYYVGSSAASVTVHKNAPNSTGTGWQVYLYNGEGYNLSTTSYAICALVP